MNRDVALEVDSSLEATSIYACILYSFHQTFKIGSARRTLNESQLDYEDDIQEQNMPYECDCHFARRIKNYSVYSISIDDTSNDMAVAITVMKGLNEADDNSEASSMNVQMMKVIVHLLMIRVSLIWKIN